MCKCENNYCKCNGACENKNNDNKKLVPLVQPYTMFMRPTENYGRLTVEELSKCLDNYNNEDYVVNPGQDMMTFAPKSTVCTVKEMKEFIKDAIPTAEINNPEPGYYTIDNKTKASNDFIKNEIGKEITKKLITDIAALVTNYMADTIDVIKKHNNHNKMDE